MEGDFKMYKNAGAINAQHELIERSVRRKFIAIFQRVIDDVMGDHIGKMCYVYIDDAILFGKTLAEQLKNLKIILETLNKANLEIQLDKSEFLHSEIEFLGYIISSEGLKPNTKKIEVINKYPGPKNLKELRSFLGMIGYYR